MSILLKMREKTDLNNHHDFPQELAKSILSDIECSSFLFEFGYVQASLSHCLNQKVPNPTKTNDEKVYQFERVLSMRKLKFNSIQRQTVGI